MEAIIASMEATWRWVVVTAVAPVTWGATYFVTRQVLPADAPLWGATLRALPAGLVLLALSRRWPRGHWWWRSLVLGTLNVGAFFLLVYLAAQLLPTSIASSIMALAPLTLAGFGWALVGERPGARLLAGAGLGIVGALLLLGVGTGQLDARGIAVSATALTSSSLGAVLGKRWGDGTPLLATTSWQMLAGGVGLLLVAVMVEGGPPAVGLTEIAGFAFVSLIATALAFVCWFAGLARLPSGTVGIVGLLNPVTGVLLGTLVASEHLATAQLVGIGLVLAGIAVGRQHAGSGVRSPERFTLDDRWSRTVTACRRRPGMASAEDRLPPSRPPNRAGGRRTSAELLDRDDRR